MDSVDPLYAAIEPRPTGAPIPLTARQLRLWNVVLPPKSKRMCAASVRIAGALKPTLLQRSIEIVLHRHESLRTRIASIDGVPRQHIDVPHAFHLDTIDLSAAPPSKVEPETARLARKFMERRIDISDGPVFDAKLLRLSSVEHVLLMATDHFVSDGVSCSILNREIWTSYAHLGQELQPSLPILPIQFADYAVWQSRVADAWRAKHCTYWRDRLRSAPTLHLPIDKEVGGGQPEWAALHTPFGKNLSRQLSDVSQQEHTLVPLVFLTVYVAAVSRWCNQSDILVEFISHNRYRRPELEHMIGWLSSPMYLRIEIDGRYSAFDLLRRVTLEFNSACAHQDFCNFVPDLIPELPEALFYNWLPSRSGRAVLDHTQAHADTLRVRPYPLTLLPGGDAARTQSPSTFPRDEPRGLGPTRFATLWSSDTAAGVCATSMYRRDLFERRTVDRLANYLRFFAAELAAGARTRVGSARA